MSDIVTFGFGIDTAPLLSTNEYFLRLQKTVESCEATFNKFGTNAAAAFKNINPALLGGGAASSSPAATAAQASAQASLATATAGATAALHGQNAALHSGAQAHAAHGAAAYANRLQMMELAHVSRALFDELAAGGNIFRALAMEGGRLQMALSTGEGGLGGLIGRLGTGMAALANPIAIATVGMTAFGAASALAFASYQAGQDKLANSLNGIGRRSGATAGQLNQVAAAGAASGGLSSSQGIGLAAQYTAAGLGPGTTGTLIGMTRDYGRVTGTGTDEAGTALAAAIRDPIKGLGELDKTLGFVDDRLAQQVQDLERSGHLAEAQATATEALRKALESTTDTTWGFSKVMERASNVISNGWHGFGGDVASLFGMASPQYRLADAQHQLDMKQRYDPTNGVEIGALRKTIDDLQKSIGLDAGKAAANKRDADATALSRQAGDAVRSILPDIARANSAKDTLEVLRQALGDPVILSKMAVPTGVVSRAYGDAIVMQAQATPGLRQKQDYDLSLAAADAFSVGEKAVVEARRAELAVLRETGDVARAATAAQMSMNEAIAKGNSDAEDRLEKAKQDFALIGLSPYQRARQEVINKYDGYGGIVAKDEIASSRALDDPDIHRDLGGASKLQNAAIDASLSIKVAGDKLADALTGVAVKVSGGTPSPYGALQPFKGAAAGGALDRAPADVRAMIADASARTGIDPSIIAAIGEKENSFRLTGGTTMLGANGKPSSAWGFGQLTNGAAADVGRIYPGFDKYDPSTSVFGSAEYLSILAARNHGDMSAALDAYGGTSGYAADIARRAGGGIPMTVHPALQQVAPIASTMAASDQASKAQDLAGVDKRFTSADPTLFGTPLGDANRSLDAQRAVLKMQADTFGQSAAAIKGASEAQQLWNRYTSEGITPTGALSDKIKAYGVDAAAVAKQQQDQLAQQQSIIGTADAFRGDFSSVFTSGLQSAAQGKGFGAGLSSALDRIGQSLIGSGVNQIASGLFGKMGTPGGGLLGSLFSFLPHFALGTNDAPGGTALVGEKGPELVNLPAHAQVMSNAALNGALSSRAPNVTVGGHSIVVQGNADEKTIAMMDAKLAAASDQQWQRIVRDLPQIQQDSQQTS